MSAINLSQIIVSIALTVLILMQSQSSGLGSTWGGGGESYHTKRGVEKVVFRSTIILTIVFAVLSIIALL